MVLINPTGPSRIREIDQASHFHQRMLKRQRRHGQMPKVRVIIQVRGHVLPVSGFRARLARAVRAMKRRGVPKDERGPLLERVMQETDTREWEDVEEFWAGTYDPDEVEMPTRPKLEEIEEEYGADEARCVVRTVT